MNKASSRRLALGQVMVHKHYYEKEQVRGLRRRQNHLIFLTKRFAAVLHVKELPADHSFIVYM